MITLAQIKQALKIDYTADDAELLRIRDAVIDLIEDYTGLSINSKKRTQYLEYWMKTRLDTYPLISIDSVKYYDTSNTLTTMESWFIIRKDYPSIFINFSELPSLFANSEIQVTYTTGYVQLPHHIEQAVIALVGHWYNQPEAGAPITLSTVPLSAQFILDNIRIKGVLE